MNRWTDDLQRAVEYMESHLTEEITISQIAAQAYVSPFHFQRIFHALCGLTVGEYLRYRRLTLAAEELSTGDAKVIDVAGRYGYDSPDSFAKAFARFHGISPSAAKEKGARLNAFAPFRIKAKSEVVNMLEYRIVEKAAFTIIGVSRRFHIDTSYEEIPKFWTEHMQSEAGRIGFGTYGACLDGYDKEFEYLIADDYLPWREIPDGFVTRTFAAGLWAVFPCRGPLPETLQSVNTRIWNEWLPGLRGYRLGGNYNIEMYAPPADRPENTYSEIWIPVEKN